jgi:hypothetical protein
MVAGRNQRPTDLILAVNRAWVFCRLPVLRLVRDFWLPDRRASRALPAFIGIDDSGRTDVSERADELLAEGFGR